MQDNGVRIFFGLFPGIAKLDDDLAYNKKNLKTREWTDGL